MLAAIWDARVWQSELTQLQCDKISGNTRRLEKHENVTKGSKTPKMQELMGKTTSNNTWFNSNSELIYFWPMILVYCSLIAAQNNGQWHLTEGSSCLCPLHTHLLHDKSRPWIALPASLHNDSTRPLNTMTSTPPIPTWIDFSMFIPHFMLLK